MTYGEPQVGIEPTTARDTAPAVSPQLGAGPELSVRGAGRQDADSAANGPKSRNEAATADSGSSPAPVDLAEALGLVWVPTSEHVQVAGRLLYDAGESAAATARKARQNKQEYAAGFWGDIAAAYTTVYGALPEMPRIIARVAELTAALADAEERAATLVEMVESAARVQSEALEAARADTRRLEWYNEKRRGMWVCRYETGNGRRSWWFNNRTFDHIRDAIDAGMAEDARQGAAAAGDPPAADSSRPAAGPQDSAAAGEDAGAGPRPLGTPEEIAAMRAGTQALRDRVAALDAAEREP